MSPGVIFSFLGTIARKQCFCKNIMFDSSRLPDLRTIVKINIHTKVCTMFILRSLIAHTCPKTSIELMAPFSSLSRIVSMARKTPVLPTPALESKKIILQLNAGSGMYFSLVRHFFNRLIY